MVCDDSTFAVTVSETKAKYPWHMSNLVSLIRLAMFSTINLVEWLNNPLRLEPKDEDNVAIDTS